MMQNGKDLILGLGACDKCFSKLYTVTYIERETLGKERGEPYYRGLSGLFCGV